MAIGSSTFSASGNVYKARFAFPDSLIGKTIVSIVQYHLYDGDDNCWIGNYRNVSTQNFVEIFSSNKPTSGHIEVYVWYMD